jgi:hypothetical protein
VLRKAAAAADPPHRRQVRLEPLRPPRARRAEEAAERTANGRDTMRPSSPFSDSPSPWDWPAAMARRPPRKRRAPVAPRIRPNP